MTETETKTKTILVVDDDAEFAESVRDLLEAYGYVVLTAPDGSQGLKIALEAKPDLMILDVMMATNTEGFDVARRVHAIPELVGMPILLVTGVVNAMHLPKPPEPDSEWLPVDRVLEKPIDPARLMKEVERVLHAQIKGGVRDEQEDDPAGG